MAKAKVNVVVAEGEEPLYFEVLQDEIVKLANVGRQIDASRLKQRAIVLLLHDHTKVPKANIRYILNALPALEEMYLK